MPSKKCSNCGLYNPDSALLCDCGLEFQSGQLKEPYLSRRQQVEEEKPRSTTLQEEILLFCKNCRKERRFGDIYCRQCGTKLSQPVTETTSDSNTTSAPSLQAPLKPWVPAAGLASMLLASMISYSFDRVHGPPLEVLGYAVGATLAMSLLSLLGIGIVTGIVKLFGTVKPRQWYQTVFWAFGGLWLLLALIVAMNRHYRV
jgi:hypothetical protein